MGDRQAEHRLGSFRAGDFFDKLGWKTEEALLGYLSQLEHTGNTLVQTQQTISANFFSFLVAKEGSMSFFQIGFRSVSRASKDSRFVVEHRTDN